MIDTAAERRHWQLCTDVYGPVEVQPTLNAYLDEIDRLNKENAMLRQEKLRLQTWRKLGEVES